ncbi:Nuclear fragile X mental retardation-interacting protein 1 [Mycena indigotica]|uniref:Nuclear fragile X mental retardation-interacting protein 1 n=1 Tax=Mycena indigotica TaxID=2126181 RepID=A0A8H6SXC0_9AGAR|nr:Nuclear fragile X mental retardation-interacting protein 1 [Mycena indigotica]KAF7306998.1 Nuclear fragile X mental retardation-interacting protein 1 [Mycena indigotica]
MQQPPWPFQTYYSAHYAAAYQQQQQQQTRVNLPNLPVAGPSKRPPGQPSSAWYQPGNVRCTYKTCTFSGSKQSVETHMMDRHLIFPAGWDKRKKEPQWDADPSLKGKQVPIQGTGIMLNTPEKLAEWLAERKRRWPSAQLVAEKKRKLEEAAARGELAALDMGRKRQRTENNESRGRGRGKGRGRGTLRGRGKGRGNAPMPTTSRESSGSSSEDDSPPEALSSKKDDPPPIPAQPVSRPRVQQPKNPVHNVFASRPTLLRNLLLPEIRITVSNLSQAIHFLVDNDFLQDVELKPGQANQRLVQVLEAGGNDNNISGQ